MQHQGHMALPYGPDGRIHARYMCYHLQARYKNRVPLGGPCPLRHWGRERERQRERERDRGRGRGGTYTHTHTHGHTHRRTHTKTHTAREGRERERERKRGGNLHSFQVSGLTPLWLCPPRSWMSPTTCWSAFLTSYPGWGTSRS
jgi:hypothetical protein